MQGATQAATAVSIPGSVPLQGAHSSPREGAGDTEEAKAIWVQWLVPLL